MMRRPLSKSPSTAQARHSAICSIGKKLDPAQTHDRAPHAKNSSAHVLSPQNSERLVRVLRTVEKAKDAFGDEHAVQWLEKPSKVFHGKAPIELLANESGSRVVEMFIDRSMHGFNA